MTFESISTTGSEGHVVRAYHGTTVSAADAIAREGSRPPDVEDLVRWVAHAYRVTEKALRVGARSRYISVGHRRRRFSAALHPAVARLYAGRRGGEASHELVTAALLLRHAHLTESEAGQLATQAVAESPALVALDVPFEHIADELPRPRHQLGGWGHHRDWVTYSESVVTLGAGDNMHLDHVDASWVCAIDVVEPVVGEHTLARAIPPEARSLLLRSTRPESIGPEMIPVYTERAVKEWLSQRGFTA